MLRAIIGTVAVLAGFGVLERSVDASTGHAGSCTATQAYALIQRGDMVPVRAEPTLQAPVIGTLSGRAATGELARSQVTIMGSQSGWARIALNTAQGYAAADAAPQSFGWMPADLLTVDARVDGTITAVRPAGSAGLGDRHHRRRRHEVSRARLPRHPAAGRQRPPRPCLDRQVVRPRGGLPRLNSLEGQRVVIWGFDGTLRDSTLKTRQGDLPGFFFLSRAERGIFSETREIPRFARDDASRQIFNSLKKSLPLSSVTMKAGKFSTWMRQIASMPSSGYSSTSTLRMQFLARMAAGPPIEPR